MKYWVQGVYYFGRSRERGGEGPKISQNVIRGTNRTFSKGEGPKKGQNVIRGKIALVKISRNNLHRIIMRAILQQKGTIHCSTIIWYTN